jgi:exopolysaccharide production protein ExoZ
MKNLNSIQTLRFFAAFIVLLYHIRETIVINDVLIGELLFRNGAIGVDVFFVISGFIMEFSIKEDYYPKKYSLKFFVKRLSRIIPLYFLATFLYIIFFSNIHNLVQPWFIKEIFKAFAFIPIDFKHVGPFYGQPILIVGWTLNYEMFFYAIFSISLIFSKIRYHFLISIAVSFLIIIPIINQFMLQGKLYEALPYLKLCSNTINYDFIFGVLIGFVYKKRKVLFNYFFLIVLFSTSVILFCIQLMTNYLYGYGLEGWGISSALIVFSLLYLERDYGMKFSKYFVWGGGISYSIYLLHVLVFFALLNIYQFFNFSEKSIILTLLCISITMAVSQLSRFLIEIRLSEWIKNKIFALIN